jgi:hypothetical protein
MGSLGHGLFGFVFVVGFIGLDGIRAVGVAGKKGKDNQQEGG